MFKLKTYKTPQLYLDETESFLEKKELENNLILGTCYDLIGNSAAGNNNYFINSYNNGKIKASSIAVSPRAFISGISNEKDSIKLITDYYQNEKVFLNGVMGETFLSECFSEMYSKKELSRRELILQELTKAKKLKLSDGDFEIVNLSDLEIMSKWTYDFFSELDTIRSRTKDSILSETKQRIQNNLMFKWSYKGNIRSMAAIIRRSNHTGIIGLVYTPAEFRGKGYGTSCVHKLCEHILKSGYESCGLYSEKENPVSNKIYKNIGFVHCSEFSDIKFM